MRLRSFLTVSMLMLAILFCGGSQANGAGITVTPPNGIVTSEAVETDTFTIVLDESPASDVSMALSSSDITEGTVCLG